MRNYFLNQVYRSWGHTAHRGWALLLLDRRSLVQVPNAPRRQARADHRHYEMNIMESYSTRRSITTLAQGPRESPVLTLISASKKTIRTLVRIGPRLCPLPALHHTPNTRALNLLLRW